MIKKCSMLSDGGMSNTSEFNADERMIKYSNILQLAMNEVTNTLNVLLYKKKTAKFAKKIEEKKGKDEYLKPNIAKAPYKSRSMVPQQIPKLEKLTTELTPEQYEYYKQMYQIMTNYLFHVLNIMPIYVQYFSLAREYMSFTPG